MCVTGYTYAQNRELDVPRPTNQSTGENVAAKRDTEFSHEAVKSKIPIGQRC